MGLIYDLARTFLRAYVVDNVPASGLNDPLKSDGLNAFAQIDSALADMALFSAIGIFEDTLADLDANLVPAANTGALVYNDATAANNGVYVKVGATGVGSWSNTGLALPSTFAASFTALVAAVPWSGASWCLTAQLKAQLVNAGVFQTAAAAISGDPQNAVNQLWNGAIVTQTGPLGAALKTALGYSDAQMTTLFAAAAALSF